MVYEIQLMVELTGVLLFIFLILFSKKSENLAGDMRNG
jgi:hypothetical protein